MRRAALALLAAAAGCAPAVWDVGPLAAREPGLRGLGAHRLGDSTPYLLPSDDVATLFLCRWPTPATIPVSLPAEATPAQRGALEAALRAWEGAGLGVRFSRGAGSAVGIELRFVEGAAQGAGAGRTATTVADCAVSVAAPRSETTLAAQIVHASIELRTASVDPLGRRQPLDDAELAGSALHELGHALGFQGHVRVGESALRSQVDAVRRAGRRLLAGEPFADAAVAALYAVPSGAVVGRVRLPPGRTQPIDRLLALARAGALVGPIVRMGDLEGQLLFRETGGEALSVWLRGVSALLAGDPAGLVVLPGPRTLRRLSPRSRRGGSRARVRPAPRRPGRASAGPRRAGTA